MFFEKSQDNRLNVRYGRIIGMCLLAIGLALVLLMLTGTDNAEAGTVVPPGSVNDAIYPGGWNNASSPYWVQGDIIIPSDNSIPGTTNKLTIDGFSGPVEVRFNGSYSLTVGNAGSGIPADLQIWGMNQNILLSSNLPGNTWEGIEITDVGGGSYIMESIIERISQGPDAAVWLNGCSGANIYHNEIREVSGLTQAVGIQLYNETGVLNTDNNIIQWNYIHNVSTLLPGPYMASGISLTNASANTIYYNEIENVVSTGGVGSEAFGIHLKDSSFNTIAPNYFIRNIQSNGNIVAGIELFGDCDYNRIELCDIYMVEALPGIGEAFGVRLVGDGLAGTAPDDNTIANNSIQNILSGGSMTYGISVSDATITYINNNTVINSINGIYIQNGAYVNLLNNEICDNVMWGIYMDDTSSGKWEIDAKALLANNPAKLKGSIQVTAGKLTLYNILSSEVEGVSIAPGGLMELGKSPNSLITNDVWVEGTLYVNSSKWEVDVAFNGEHGIQVNSTGQMYIQDNGTGPSIITDGPSDNDIGLVGADNFRYYFKVLTGAKFRLLDSEVSEVGWVTGGVNDMALYIQTSDALISNNRLLRGFYGILIQGGGWTFENNEIDDVDRTGMRVEGGSGTVITNNTINTTDVIGWGMLLSDFGHWIENNTIITLGGSAHAILLNGGGNHDILLNTITTSGSGADGILFDSSFNNRAYDNTIQVPGGNSARCMSIYSATGNQLQGNTLSDGAYGIYLEDVGSTRIGNNTVTDCDNGIILINSPGVQLYNNEIFDNFPFWGIYMDTTSSGDWYVDDFGSLINNPAVVNGSLIITTGKLTFYNVEAELLNVHIDTNGLMEVGASPTSVLSNNVWVDGVLYINSSKWEIDVSANGEYGIQVNSTGTMIIQDNGTGPSTITDGPFDNDGGSVGTDDFRYYFRVMFASTFRLYDSEVSEVGWHSSPADESAVIIYTSDLAISDSWILRNYDGIYASGDGWAMYDTVFDDMDRKGMILNGANGVVIDNCTFNTTGVAAEGIYAISSDLLEITNNTFRTLGVLSYGLYLSSCENGTIFNNDIIANISWGVYVRDGGWNEVSYNTVSDSDNGIRLYQSQWNDIMHNTVSSCSNDGIHVNTPTGRNTIYNNTVIDNWIGIVLTDGIDQIVEKNRAYLNFHGYRISGSYNKIIHNNASGNTGVGMWISNAENNTIMFNDLFNNDEGVFLSVGQIYGNKIAHNNITWNIATGIYISQSSGNLVTNNFIANTTAGNGVDIMNTCIGNIVANNTISDNNDGIRLTTVGVSETTIINNTFVGNTIGVNVDLASDTVIFDNDFWTNPIGINIQPNSNGNSAEANRITGGTTYGINVESSASITIGNNTLWGNDYGIRMITSSSATLINNEIFDNPTWGLWMDGTSSATWYVDNYASLINNPVLLTGDIRVMAGKLTFYNVGSSEVQGIAISTGGLMELGASPASLISNNVTIDGEVFINSSKWEVDVSANSEFGIQVNSTGTMVIQDNGTGPSEITDGPSDNDGGIVGTDDFRYFFKVLAGSTFRLYDSIVSEAGWDTAFQERGPYIATTDAHIDNGTFRQNNYGVIISGGGWTIENCDIYEIEIIGMWVEGALGTVIMNNTINTTGIAGNGMLLGSNGNWVENNTITSSNNIGRGIYLSGSADNDILDNTITTTGNSGHGIYVVSSPGNRIYNNIIDVSGTNANGIYLSSSPDNQITINTISNAVSGIRIEDSTSISIGNNTVYNNDFGVYVDAISSVILYNNEIFDNILWGIRMDMGSSGVWYVDSYTSLINNDGYFIGPLTVLSTGDMDIEIATLTIHDVSVDSGGILDVLNSYSTIISWNLTINGITTLDNSSWEINNTFDGEHWIMVTPTGTLNVMNDSLISAFNTAYHYDFFVDGTATFTDSTVEYVGYDFDIGSTGIFVTSSSVSFNNMVIRHSTAGIGVEGASITIQNVEIYNCSVGIALFNGSSQVLDSLDIHDMDGTNFAIGIVAENYTDVTISNVTIYNVTSTGMGMGILMTEYSHNYSMENIDISNMSAFGMFLEYANGIIKNVNINDCWVGVQTEQSYVSITNMDIADTSLLGMSIQVNSSVQFFSGTIIDCQGGIRVAYSSFIIVNNSLIENRTINNMTTGIFAQDGTAILFNTTVLNQSAGVQGIDGSTIVISDSLMDSNDITVAAEDYTVIYIVNSSITNGKNLDFFLNGNSHIVSLNTTFDNSSVMFTDIFSTLTVQWFLHIKVEGVFAEPVPGAKVWVTDNVNGSYDVNFTADAGGYVKWILITEYIQDSTGSMIFTPFTISAWNVTRQGTAFPIISKSMWVVVTLDTPTVTIDYIRLEYFNGTPVADGTILSADDDITVYARGYNLTSGLVRDVSANWVVNGGIGGLSSASGPSVTFNATTVGIGNISAMYSSFSNTTGNITIIPGAVIDITIVPPGPETYTADENFTYSVYGYDSDGNANITWIPEWSWDGDIVGNFTKVTANHHSYRIEFTKVGSSLIRVNDSDNPSVFNNSAVTVVPGKVVTIIIIPSGAEINTTDEVFNFTVEGYDAYGNLNTTWVPDAGWVGPDLGIITILGYDVSIEFTTVGSGNIEINDSADPAVLNDTKSFTVNPGAPYRILYVSGSGQTGLADSILAAPFVVLVEDFDGNPVPNVEINWSLDGWPVGALGQMLSDYNSMTDANGEATTILTLGDLAGTYWVNATNVTLTLVGEPVTYDASVTFYTIDEIIITDGSGTPITDITLTADDTLTMYAWAFNYTGGLLGQVAVNWSSLGGIGGFTTNVTLQSQVTFDITTIGMGNITIEFMNATLTLTNSTGDITVMPGAVVTIVVTPSIAVGTTDDSEAFSAVGYDADGNENWTWQPMWNWDGSGLGVLLPIDAFNYSVTYDSAGSDVVNVSLGSDPSIFNTTQVITTTLPTVDYIVIMDAPGGVGKIIDTQNFSVGQSVMFYAAGFNLTSGYVMDMEVTWASSNDANATVDSGPGTSTNFTANMSHGGVVTVTATNAYLPVISNSTGMLRILAPTVDDIQIRDSPANDGSVVLTRSYSEGQTETFYAAGYNDTAGYIGDVDVSWESLNPSVGVVSPGSGTSTIFTAGTVSGTTTVTVIYLPGISDDTGTLTVSVIAPPLTIDYIEIRDAPGGLGSAVTQISLVAGGRITVHAAGYNSSTGEFVDNVSVTWDVTVGMGTLDITSGTSTTFTAIDTTGSQVTGTLMAVYSGINATTDVTVELLPLAPMGIIVTQRPEGDSLRITWVANIENDIEGYVIFRSTSSGADFTELTIVPGISSTQYTDTGLTDGTTYYYYLMAFDTNQNFSPPSAEASGESDTDTDGDGTYDLQDNDDDGDGLSDAEEDALGTDPLDSDTDDDGHDDLEDKYPLDPAKWKKDDEKEAFPIAFIVIPIILIVLILLFLLLKKRKDEEEMPPEEEELEGMEEAEELPEEDLEALSEEGYFEDEDESSFDDDGSWDDEEEFAKEGEVAPEEEGDISGTEEEGLSEEGESETEEDTGLEDLATEFECPDCDSPISGSMEKCPNCGIELEFGDEE
jgi:parallel beta-helix repeat protein